MPWFEKAFAPSTPVIVVPKVSDCLHLKSVLSHVDETTLVVWAEQPGVAAADAMGAAELGYRIITVPGVYLLNRTSSGLTVNSHDFPLDFGFHVCSRGHNTTPSLPLSLSLSQPRHGCGKRALSERLHLRARCVCVCVS